MVDGVVDVLPHGFEVLRAAVVFVRLVRVLGIGFDVPGGCERISSRDWGCNCQPVDFVSQSEPDNRGAFGEEFFH